MCLAVIALAAHPRYTLVLATNRDEFYARPATPAAWGTDGVFAGILAGRDQEAGGTWLGVDRRGRVAFVTNVRQGTGRDPRARSRGELAPRLLRSPLPLTAALTAIAHEGAAYNGFNLLAADATGAGWTSNRTAGVHAVTPGVHGLSNAALDTPWPKVERTKAALAHWCARGADDAEDLFTALTDRAGAADAELPATGVPLAWERVLAAPFIVGDGYGTRCSTVLTIDRSGSARFEERSFGPGGDPIGTRREAFQVEMPIAIAGAPWR
ncbi:MAG: NRDE family protein [Burkholderiales bacterium]|nr:NRDE family protein [Burkholderiales bacterium]